MPKLRKIGLTLTLATALLSNVSAQQANPLLSDAMRHFELRSFPTAIQKFESLLKDGSTTLSESEKLSALLKLASSYKQANDVTNAERVFRQVFASSSDLMGDNTKSYLQFAQVLAENGKYKESQEFYDKFSTSQVVESQSVNSFRPVATSKISEDVSALTSGKGKYKVDFLDFNTANPEFSPMYYRDGIVYCSGKGSGTSLLNEKGGYLDLFYLNDISNVQGLGSDGNAKKPKRISSGGVKSLGNDYYSRPTANDSKTLNFFGGTDEAVAKVKGQIAESEIFSKTLNTKFHEGPATFSKDFTQIIFTRNNYNAGEKGASEDNVTKLKLYSAENANGAWGEATELPFNDDEYSTAHPTWSKDGKFLYFASDREGGLGGMDIWMVEYKGGNWGEPKNLGKDVNSKGVEAFPFVDDKGNLYYSSDGWGGDGGLDLFFVEMKNGANANKPVSLGEPFNSPNDDFGIITDGNRKTGYFSSDRKRGEDDDIYRFSREAGTSSYDCREMTVSIFDPETKEPVADTDVEINPKGGTSEKKRTDKNGNLKFCTGQNLDYSMKIGKEGYVTNFIGYSTKGEADDEPSRLEVPLMKVQIVEPEPEPQAVIEKVVVAPTSSAPVYKPESLTKKKSLLKGVVKTEVEKMPIEGVLVTFKNDCDNSTQQVMTGPDGVYAFNMTDGCDYTLEVSKDGYGTNVNKIKKVKKGKAKEISLGLGLFKEGDLITMDNIYYDSNKATIRKDAARELDKLAATLQKFPSMVIELGSHTDSKGEAQDNMNLSEKRAQAAVDYIAKKGIDKSRMLAKGYGESDLMNTCVDGVSCTEAEHQKNRRTTVKIIKVRTE